MTIPPRCCTSSSLLRIVYTLLKLALHAPALSPQPIHNSFPVQKHHSMCSILCNQDERPPSPGFDDELEWSDEDEDEDAEWNQGDNEMYGQADSDFDFDSDIELDLGQTIPEVVVPGCAQVQFDLNSCCVEPSLCLPESPTQSRLKGRTRDVSSRPRQSFNSCCRE